MLMSVSIFFISIIISFNCFSYTPTLDSLLRNGNNSEIATKSVVANIKIKEISPTNQNEELTGETALKYVIYNENEQRPQMVELEYAGGNITSSMLMGFKYINIKDLKSINIPSNKIESQVYYSLLVMLLNNNSRPLIDFLQSQNIKVLDNRNLINENKIRLISAYKRYLQESKDDESNVRENPLKPEDPKDLEKVNEVMSESFLRQDQLVKRVKDKNEFYWVAQSDNLFIKFNKDHRMKIFRLLTDLGTIEVTLGRFVVMGSQQEFPEFIWFKTLSGKKYEIRATKYSSFKDNKDSHRNRLKRYSKYKEQNKVSSQLERLELLK